MKLEKRKKELELSRVKLAREELEFKIMERLDEIERLKLNIQIQIKRETELKEEINKL